MKKSSALLVALVLALGLTACGSSKLRIREDSTYTIGSSYDVSLEIVDGTLTPTSATVRISNNTDTPMISGNTHDFLIEARREGKWKEIDRGEWSNTAEAAGYTGTGEFELDWSRMYGKLPAGDYRILKCFWFDDIDENFILGAEFTIK